MTTSSFLRTLLIPALAVAAQCLAQSPQPMPDTAFDKQRTLAPAPQAGKLEHGAAQQHDGSASPPSVTPLQSPAVSTAQLTTLPTPGITDVTVAGTCTVIDALVADYCLQSSNDPYCQP